jgi:hypothetical protein
VSSTLSCSLELAPDRLDSGRLVDGERLGDTFDDLPVEEEQIKKFPKKVSQRLCQHRVFWFRQLIHNDVCYS